MYKKFWDADNREEKERERKKKIAYGNILKEQIEDNKRRKEQERQRKIKEDQLYLNTLNENKQNQPQSQPFGLKNFNVKNNIYNNSNYHYNFQDASYKNDRVNQNKQIDSNIHGYFKEFVQEQMNVITNYERNLDNIIFTNNHTNTNSIEFENSINMEYNKAIGRIKNEQCKLKGLLGYFPLEENYNRKIEELFDKILSKKISCYNEINISKNKLNIENINSQRKEKIKELTYKSKYENLQETVPNFDNLDADEKNSLVGFSKLVQIQESPNDVNKCDKGLNFLQTWRENLIQQETNRNKTKTEKVIIKQNEEKRIFIEDDKTKKEIQEHIKKKNKLSDKNLRIRISPFSLKKNNSFFDRPKTLSTILPEENEYLLNINNDLQKKKTESQQKEEHDNYSLPMGNIEEKVNNPNISNLYNKKSFITESQTRENEINEEIEEKMEKSAKTKQHRNNEDLIHKQRSYQSDYPINKQKITTRKKRLPFSGNIPPFSSKCYKQESTNSEIIQRHKNENSNDDEMDLPMGVPEIKGRPLSAAVNDNRRQDASIDENIKKKNTYSSQTSEGDNILKDIENFRQIALSNINNLNNSNIKPIRTKAVSLIPKEVIQNYHDIISTGSRK